MLWGLDLNNIANVIILISAVIIAIKTIYAFVKKPVEDVQKSVKEAEEQHIKDVLNQEMPGLLATNCEVIMSSLNEIKQMTLQQEDKLVALQASLDLINQALLDTMRYNMNRLYYKYRPYKKILDADKKAFMKFYTDYHSMGGNTWIDSLYQEVITWEIVGDESELKT